MGEIYKDNKMIHALPIEIVCGVSMYIYACSNTYCEIYAGFVPHWRDYDSVFNRILRGWV
jgi:hypothetical protein